MKILPSILSADFANLQAEIERVPSADGIHVDVMDNQFVPNLTIGAPVVEALQRVTDHELDIHLMIADADRWAPAYADLGVASVTFHVEASVAPFRLVGELRRLGARVAIGLRPATPIEPYAELLACVDQVLIMTVEPGFAGQAFLAEMLPKIERTRALVSGSGRRIAVQVDGGVSAATIERAAAAGADVFVAGSAVFSALDPDAMVNELRGLADAARVEPRRA